MGERKFEHVKMELIDESDYQVRVGVDEGSFRELVGSVRRDGVLVPVLLHTVDERFVVVAGHRRCAAAKEAGLETIPAYILVDEDPGGWGYAMAENLFRLDISPIETACAINDCLESGKYDAEAIARVMGRSVGWVRNCVQFVSWPEDLQEAVHIGKISVAAAANLAKIGEREHRSILISYAAENGATARTTAAWLQAWDAGKDLNNPSTIAPLAGAPSPTPIEPWTPCVLCGNKLRMVEMSYQPVCHNCTMDLLQMRREKEREKNKG